MSQWQGIFIGIISLVAGCWALASHFVVHIPGDEAQAKYLAEKYGFSYIRKLFSDSDFYYFELQNDNSSNINIKNEANVSWIEKQTFRYRRKRFIRNSSRNRHSWKSELLNQIFARKRKNELLSDDINSIHFNDPYYVRQWYLHNEENDGHELNVLPVWKMGYTGRGITLSVLDDGILYTNPDIYSNYESSISSDVVDLKNMDKDPMPDLSQMMNVHGTYCAAIMAAVANNSYCGVGVAYDAKVGGVRVIEDKPVSDMQEALALDYGINKADIYSASWGPEDDGKRVDGPGKLASHIFKKGIEKGRNGKGIIYVWAVGNGGLEGDNCNLDGYVSSIYTLSVNALTSSGLSCYYDEPCSSALASTYIGGLHIPPNANLDIDVEEVAHMNVVVPDVDGNCHDRFEGTSAAAPMAAGMIALVLQANPTLSWRDVQHIVATTSKKCNDDKGWSTNGAGLYYHLMYGFGALDALKMVTAALNWTNVPEQEVSYIPFNDVPRNISKDSNTIIELNVTINETNIENIEHVIVKLFIKHPARGKLEIFVTSPPGTTSQLLTKRKHDKKITGFRDWGFMSVHFWNENPIGKWKVTIVNHSDFEGSLTKAELQLYGFHKTHNKLSFI